MLVLIVVIAIICLLCYCFRTLARLSRFAAQHVNWRVAEGEGKEKQRKKSKETLCRKSHAFKSSLLEA